MVAAHAAEQIIRMPEQIIHADAISTLHPEERLMSVSSSIHERSACMFYENVHDLFMPPVCPRSTREKAPR